VRLEEGVLGRMQAVAAAVGVAAGGDDDDDIEQIGAEALAEPVEVAHVVTWASRRLRGTPLASVRHHGR